MFMVTDKMLAFLNAANRESSNDDGWHVILLERRDNDDASFSRVGYFVGTTCDDDHLVDIIITDSTEEALAFGFDDAKEHAIKLSDRFRDILGWAVVEVEVGDKCSVKIVEQSSW